MKKLVSLLLALALAAGCALGAAAEEAEIELSVSEPEATGESALPADIVVPDADYQIDEAALQQQIEAQLEAELAVMEPAAEALEQDYSEEISEALVNAQTTPQNFDKTLEGFVTRLYTIALHRSSVDPSGYNTFVGGLRYRNNPMYDTGAKVAFGIFASEEYKRRITAGLTNTQLITEMYNVFMGREPDAAGLKYWLDLMDNGVTYLGVMRGFAESREFEDICNSFGVTRGMVDATRLEQRDLNYGYTQFVYRLYTQCLGRAADIGGLNNWVGALRNGVRTGAQVASEFIFSTEYKNKHTSNTEFVVMLYRTFLGREPDYPGLVQWYTKASTGTSRQQLVNGFLFSREFQELCRQFAVNLGTNMVEEPDGTVEWKLQLQLLSQVNGLRNANGRTALLFRQDLYDVAHLRTNELPGRWAQISKLDDMRPNGSSYLSAYSEVGVLFRNGQEVRARTGSDVEISKLWEAWKNDSSTQAKLLDTGVNYFGAGHMFRDSYAWYCMELASLIEPVG